MDLELESLRSILSLPLHSRVILCNLLTYPESQLLHLSNRHTDTSNMYVPHSVPEKSKLNISENWADYTKIKYYRL